MFAQRHPLQKRWVSVRERERELSPKTNQTGHDGIRRPPGATTDGFTPVHTRDRRWGRGANCATIWFTSSERKTTPVARGGGGGAAALTLCYDKYIFLFVLLIWPYWRYPSGNVSSSSTQDWWRKQHARATDVVC